VWYNWIIPKGETMEYIRYKKPTDSMNKSGVTKGVKTAPMKVFFQDGKNPYKEGMVLIVLFKQKRHFAKVEGINGQSVTVSLDGIDGKKVIRYNNILSVITDIQ
jgi:hypothetical protein